MFYTFTYKNWLLLEILTNENLLGNFKLAWIYFEKLGTLVTFFDDIIDFHESSQNDIPQRIVKITSLDKVKICLIIIFSSFLHWHFDETREWKKKRMPNQLFLSSVHLKIMFCVKLFEIFFSSNCYTASFFCTPFRKIIIIVPTFFVFCLLSSQFVFY